MQSMYVFLDITKNVDFLWKNDGVSRAQGVYHVIQTFFGSSLGKIWLWLLHHVSTWATARTSRSSTATTTKRTT